MIHKNRESRDTIEQREEHHFTLAEILGKLDQYTIMVEGVSDALSHRGKTVEETIERYALAEKILDSLVKTPALFEGLSLEVREKYGHHDLFQDFYNKVVSRCTLMHENLLEFKAAVTEYYWLTSRGTLEKEELEKAMEKLEDDSMFFERVTELWPYYKLIMEALVVRSYNIKSGHSNEYTVPEKIGEARVQKDIDARNFFEVIKNFFKAYPKTVYIDHISLFCDPALQSQYIHVSEGVVFNIIRNIIGNVISSEKQEKVRAHRLVIGCSLFLAQTGEPYFQITISDDGQGVPSRLLPEIFKEGVSGTDSTGFGLAHIDEFIKSMGGTIFVESQENKKDYSPNKRFRFEDIAMLTPSEFGVEIADMNTTFTLQFPLVQN